MSEKDTALDADVEEVMNNLSSDADADEEEVREDLEQLMSYRVPKNERIRTVTDDYSESDGSSSGSSGNSDYGSVKKKIGDLSPEDDFVNVHARVANDVDRGAKDDEAQRLAIEDETSSVFMIRKHPDGEVPENELWEEGESYEFTGLSVHSYVDEGEQKYTLYFNDGNSGYDSDVDEVELSRVDPVVSISGDNTGPKPFKNKEGKAMRMLGKVDDGTMSAPFDINQHNTPELAEKLGGLTMEDANEYAAEFKNDQIAPDMMKNVVGRYIDYEYSHYYDFFSIESADFFDGDVTDEAQELVTRLQNGVDSNNDPAVVRQDEDEVREVAKRVFAREFNNASFVFKEPDEERDNPPKYLLLPSGDKMNRVFLAGTLTEVTRTGSGFKGRIICPSGPESDDVEGYEYTFYFTSSGKYNPMTHARLMDWTVEDGEDGRKLESPKRISIVAKPRVWIDEDDGVDLNLSMNPESDIPAIQEITEAEYQKWIVETAERTLDRLDRFASGENKYVKMAKTGEGAPTKNLAFDDDGVDASAPEFDGYDVNLQDVYDGVGAALSTVVDEGVSIPSINLDDSAEADSTDTEDADETDADKTDSDETSESDAKKTAQKHA